MASNGASLATIDAKLKFPPNTIYKLLDKGKAEKVGPYRRFFTLFRSWAADARWAAEETMAKKSPDKWLERNTTARTIESEEDRSLITSNPQQNQQNLMDKDKMIRSLRLLKQAGISIDKLLEQGHDISFLPEEEEKEDESN